MFVETRTFLSCLIAYRIEGTRYPSDLPTPVPASTIRCSLASIESETATAISSCSGLDSYPMRVSSSAPLTPNMDRVEAEIFSVSIDA